MKGQVREREVEGGKGGERKERERWRRVREGRGRREVEGGKRGERKERGGGG